MRIVTVLNKCENFKGFVLSEGKWRENEKTSRDEIVFAARPRKNSHALCSQCKRKAPVYDHLKIREFQHVPMWGIAIFILYCMRRVNCPHCGVKVEYIPWGVGKNHMTLSFMLFLANWARSLSWSETAERFHTGWKQVCHAVSHVVEWGLAHRVLDGIEAIGVDEIQYGHGQSYLTLVYQLCGPTRRLLYLARNRTEKSLLGFFNEQGPAVCKGIRFVCSDMWKPYLNVIAAELKSAVHILDRYHIVAKLNEAVDTVRRQESKQLVEKGYVNPLTKTKYCFLKNPENLTDKQELRLDDVLQYDLKSVRAYLLKESFQCLWDYKSAHWAGWFLRQWCARAMRSRLQPIKTFVKTVRSHQELILNWFKAKKMFSSGAVEGMNRKFNLVTRKSYGFRTYDVLRIAMFHTLGCLPEPVMTHRY